MKGLYIHIPFCKSICNYCDFPKMIAKECNYEQYILRVIEEIKYYRPHLNNITSVFIGGGTPNVLPDNILIKLLESIKDVLSNSIENTIEINPELLTLNQAQIFKKYNVNRVSMGIQTLNPNLIKLINRHHTKDIVKNAFSILKKNDIKNINVDLMFGIPTQTLTDIKDDLSFIYDLNPSHISYYSLILEEKTVFSFWLKNNKIKLLDDDTIADMYDYINNSLEEHNYKHYEISNYAKNDYESIHNKLYWNTQEYIGVGLSACGYLNNIRYSNNHLLKDYYKSFICDKELITKEDAKKEFLLLGLRLVDGVDINEYNSRFNSSLLDDFKDNIERLIKNNLIEISNNHIKIKKDKLFIGNLVFEEFVD